MARVQSSAFTARQVWPVECHNERLIQQHHAAQVIPMAAIAARNRPHQVFASLKRRFVVGDSDCGNLHLIGPAELQGGDDKDHNRRHQ